MSAPYTASDSPLWKAVDVLGRINNLPESYSLPIAVINEIRHALAEVGYFQRERDRFARYIEKEDGR